MNKLELAQEIYDKQQKLGVSERPQGFNICITETINELTFMVWHDSVGLKKWLEFNANLDFINNKNYPESIDEARAALKEFLESEV